MTTTFKNVPDEIHSKILDTYLESPSIDFKTLKKMTLISKSNNLFITDKLNFLKNPNVQYFCKLQHIDNILLIVKRSAFDLEKLSKILTYVFESDFKDKRNIDKLVKLCKVSFPESIKYDFVNNTFIIFQLLKHTIKKNKSAVVVENNSMYIEPFDKIIDNILFQFFDDLYTYKNKTSPNKNIQSILTDESFTSENIDYSWHVIGFNLYYFYEKYRLLQENKMLTKKDFKDIPKYIFSTNHEISKNSIKYITQQEYQNNLNKNSTYVFSFIISEMIKQKLIHMDDRIKLQYEDNDGETIKRYEQVAKIYEYFNNL